MASSIHHQQPPPPHHPKKKVEDTLSGVVDALRLQRLESEQTLEDGVQATHQWLTAEIEACKQKVTESSRGRKKKKAKKQRKKAAASTANNNSNNKSAPAATAGGGGGGAAGTSAITASVSFASPEPPPKDRAFQRVEAHRVKSLKKELKKRGLETGGLKKTLRERLVDALVEEDQQQKKTKTTQPPQQQSAGATKATGETGAGTAAVPKSNHDDAIANDGDNSNNSVIVLLDSPSESMEVDGGETEPHTKPPPAASAEVIVLDGAGASCDSNKNDSGDAIPMEEEKVSSGSLAAAAVDAPLDSNNTIHQSPQKQAPQSKVEGSGRKRVRSPVRMVQSAIRRLSPASKSPVHKRLATAAVATATSLEQQRQSPAPKKNIDSAKADESRDEMEVEETVHDTAKESQTKASGTMVAPAHSAKPDVEEQPLSSSKGPVRLLAPAPSSAVRGVTTATSITTPCFSQHNQDRVKQMSETYKAKEAARKARLAGIREKSKPTAVSKPISTPSEYEKNLSSLKATKAYGTGEEGKRKQLAAIREKALGQHHHQKANKPAATTPMTTSSSTTTTASATAPVVKKPAAATATLDNSKNYKPGPTTTKMSKLSPAIAYSAIKKKSTKSAPLSPMSTYEISDHEGDTDSEDEENANKRKPKKIPDWARKANLNPALEYQFSVGQCALDPDEIFGEVQTCDLKAIFNQDKSRYKNRTSSGIWTRDRATSAEKLAYKRDVQHRSALAA